MIHCWDLGGFEVKKSGEHEVLSVLYYSRFLLSMIFVYRFVFVLGILSLCLLYLFFCVLCYNCSGLPYLSELAK